MKDIIKKESVAIIGRIIAGSIVVFLAKVFLRQLSTGH